MRSGCIAEKRAAPLSAEQRDETAVKSTAKRESEWPASCHFERPDCVKTLSEPFGLAQGETVKYLNSNEGYPVRSEPCRTMNGVLTQSIAREIFLSRLTYDYDSNFHRLRKVERPIPTLNGGNS